MYDGYNRAQCQALTEIMNTLNKWFGGPSALNRGNQATRLQANPSMSNSKQWDRTKPKPASYSSSFCEGG